MRISRLFAIPLFVFCCNALALDAANKVTSGFISDYQRLTPALSADADFHRYLAPEAAQHKIGKVFLKPLGVYPDNASFDYIDRATMSALFSKFDAAIAKQLGSKVTLVTDAAQADTIVQVAITAVSAVEPDRKIVDFIPIRLLAKPLKDAALGKQQAVAVQLEMSVKDGKSGQILAEALGDIKGDTMGRTGNASLNADIKTLQPVIDQWASKIIETMNRLGAPAGAH